MARSRVAGDPLRKGDSYTVNAYAPTRPGGRCRRQRGGFHLSGRQAPVHPHPAAESGRRRHGGNRPGGDAARESSLALRQTLQIPLRGDLLTGDEGASQVLRDSRYADMYQLALDWTAGAETGYDRVKAIESNLQENYRYSERVPTRPLPLNGFLFQDEAGYCQQFSGTMALMLRMVGIPARVAAGFSPGSYNTDTKEFRVRDLDAHSWVEVFFTGIGWVPFDPTPTAAPAESQSAGVLATSAARLDAGEVTTRRAGVAAERGSDTGGALGEEGGTPDWLLPFGVLVALGLLAGGGWYVVRLVRVKRHLGAEQMAAAQLAELRRALDRLDWNVPTATTLLGLERRLLRYAGPHSAGYARRLREHRYDPRHPAAPGPRERRALRKELSRGGLGARLRGLLSIPPGGPKPVP